MLQRLGVILIAAGIASLLFLNFINAKQQSSTHTIISTSKAPSPIGPYSQAIMAGNTLYVAGQVGISPSTGKLDTTGIESETKQAMQNITAVLEAAKMGLGNIVKTSIYLTDLNQFKAMNKVYGEFFDNIKTDNPQNAKTYPARETVQVAALPKGAHVEISVIAVK